MIDSATFAFVVLKVFCGSSFHYHLTLSLVSLVIGSIVFALSLMWFFMKLIVDMKILIFFLVFGAFIFTMPWILEARGLQPVSVTQKPRNSNSFWHEYDLSKFAWNTAWCNAVNFLSKHSTWFSNECFNTAKTSSI